MPHAMPRVIATMLKLGLVTTHASRRLAITNLSYTRKMFFARPGLNPGPLLTHTETNAEIAVLAHEPMYVCPTCSARPMETYDFLSPSIGRIKPRI